MGLTSSGRDIWRCLEVAVLRTYALTHKAYILVRIPSVIPSQGDPSIQHATWTMYSN